MVIDVCKQHNRKWQYVILSNIIHPVQRRDTLAMVVSSVIVTKWVFVKLAWPETAGL